MAQSLAGRIILITGASSGIGAHFARIVAQQGAAVIIGARRIDKLDSLCGDIRNAGGRALAVPLDVSQEASVISAFDAAEAEYGPVTGVVANAGVNFEGRAIDLSVERFDQIFTVNVRGVFLTAREGARRMRAAGVADLGRIVLISSITAKMRTSGTTAYSASKAAVSHMGRLMAREWRSGPNVNILSPGYIRSELAGDWFETEDGHRQMASWPRRRLLDDTALDSTLIYLLSDDSRNVTGSDLVIDDGQSL